MPSLGKCPGKRLGKCPGRRRAGVALVAALGLMMLAAALLAGTAVASLGLQRAARTLAATERASSEVQREFGRLLGEWSPALDSMAVGATADHRAPVALI